MIFFTTLHRLPDFNNSLINPCIKYLNNDLICVNILGKNECYLFRVFIVDDAHGLNIPVVQRTFSNNYRI